MGPSTRRHCRSLASGQLRPQEGKGNIAQMSVLMTILKEEGCIEAYSSTDDIGRRNVK